MSNVNRVKAIAGKRVVVRVGDDIRDYYDMEVTTVARVGGLPKTETLRLSLGQAALLRLGLEQTVLPQAERQTLVSPSDAGMH